MLNFSLKSTSSFELVEGDNFIFTGGRNSYRVVLVTDKFVHSIHLETERFIRLNADRSMAPDFVYLAIISPASIPVRFDGTSLEASFLNS